MAEAASIVTFFAFHSISSSREAKGYRTAEMMTVKPVYMRYVRNSTEVPLLGDSMHDNRSM